MTEVLSNPVDMQEHLNTLAFKLDTLMAEAPEVSDGINLNRFDSSNDELGRSYGIARSVKPNKTVGYHASLQESPDAQGFVERWDYHWGAGKPHAIYTKVHQSRLYTSLVHPVDSRRSMPLASADVEINIPQIVSNYEHVRQSQLAETALDGSS